MTTSQVRWALDQAGLSDSQKMLLVVLCNSADSKDDEQRVPIQDISNSRSDTSEIEDDLVELSKKKFAIFTGYDHKYLYFWIPYYAAKYQRHDEESSQERQKDQRSARGSISPTKRLRIYRRDNFECVVCHSHHELTLDHIVPFSKNGTDADSNLQTMCRSCNRHKGARGWNNEEVHA